MHDVVIRQSLLLESDSSFGCSKNSLFSAKCLVQHMPVSCQAVRSSQINNLNKIHHDTTSIDDGNFKF